MHPNALHRWFVTVTLFALCPLALAGPTPLNQDLLENGGGEAGNKQLGEDKGSPYFDLPGWKIEEGKWLAQDGAWYEIGSPEGKRYLRPAQVPMAKMSQTVELALAKNKDRHVVLSAMIRNWDTASDLPSIQLELLDQAGGVLETKSVGPIKNKSWEKYRVAIKAPAGTQSARARLISKRTVGGHNDGYFDDVTLKVYDKLPLFVSLKAERIPGTMPPSYRFIDLTEGEITRRQWVFSDGVKLDGKTVTRSFEKEGGFDVNLKVTEKSGRSGLIKRANAVVVNAEELTLRIIKGPYLQKPTKDGMTIMWETNAAADSEVIVGTGSKQQSYTSNKAVTIHEVRVEGYQSDETQDYTVISTTGEFKIKSAPSTFTTAPNADQSWRLAVWGDSQDRPHVFGKLVEGMEKAKPDLLLGVGDLVSTGTVYAQWENRLFTPIGPLAKKVPFIAAKGNHEYDATWWYQFMSLPNNERWYAMTYGSARIIVLDTNYPFTPGTDQYKWLVKELKSPEAKNAKWLFTAHHHPPFSEIYDEQLYKLLRDHIWGLYEQAGVDINFHGHIHDYERGKYVPPKTGRRIMSVQTSGGGGSLWKDEFDGDWPQIDKVIQWKHHWCQLDMKGDELFFKAIDLEGKVIDEWKLKALPR